MFCRACGYDPEIATETKARLTEYASTPEALAAADKMISRDFVELNFSGVGLSIWSSKKLFACPICGTVRVEVKS